MKKTVLLVLFVCAIFVAFAKEFAIPASANGAFADILSGTKLLRESGVTLNESSANIVELRLGLIKKVNGTRVSFLTLPGDTFFFNETSIRLERKGRVLAFHTIKNPASAPTTIKPTKNTVPQIPTTTHTKIQPTHHAQSIVFIEPAHIVNFEAPKTYASVIDSILDAPRPEENPGLTFGEFMLIMNEMHPDSQLSKADEDAVRQTIEDGPPPYLLQQKNTQVPQKVP